MACLKPLESYSPNFFSKNHFTTCLTLKGWGVDKSRNQWLWQNRLVLKTIVYFTLCRSQVWVYRKKKTKENRNWDLHSLGFDMNETKEYLLSDCHMLGKMLRAP